MSEKRISPDECLAAYRLLGLKPIRNMFRGCSAKLASRLPKKGDYDCGCPAIAMYDAAPDPKPGPLLEWADGVYGKSYFWGFIHGVDGDMPNIDVEANGRRFVDGYADGQAAWAAVEKELLGAGV